MDGFPEELRSVVHDHWGNFPPQHPLIPDLFGVIFFFLFIVSFLGNGCVIYVFLATPKLRSPVSVKSSYDHKKQREIPEKLTENPEKTQKTLKKSKEYQKTLHR